MTQINDESSQPAIEVNCPTCGQRVLSTSALQTLYQCEACHSEFIITDGQTADSRDDELNGLHIRNVSILRRATYRTRSHFIVGSAASLVAAVEMVVMLVRNVRIHSWLGAIASVLIGAAVSILFRHCMKRALELTQELHDSQIQLPTEPQDFSGLGDGSQRVRDLENLVSGDPITPG